MKLMIRNYSLTYILALFSLFAVSQETAGPIKVELVKNGNTWQIMRDGSPYYVKGVGGQVHLDRAAAYGANSVRTWSPDKAKEVLDEAHALGMTVLMGLWVGQERQGFDYDDAKAVKGQLEGFREVVRTYKDHPALLMWGIGNENDLMYSNFKVWNAINDIAGMIHEEDPNHPTLTVTAGLDVAEVKLIQERAPNIDVYGINTYGELLGINKKIRQYGWERPYIIAEWGPDGHWEVPKTSWGVPIEQTSTEKAAMYKLRYEKGIAADPQMCIGSYVFLWGQKQETTPTWYGLFLEDGRETAVMDVLEYVWTGSWPTNRAPEIQALTINGMTRYDSPIVAPGELMKVEALVEDADGDRIDYSWELLPESTDIGAGGDVESRPESVNFRPVSETRGKLELRAPVNEGPYRMFIYAGDGKGKVAVANIPFYVKKDT